ncbi:hypothetical protein T440DRAFT_540872 [Plenodomus tracheiphilus IPT5]|uniref:BTB domain-containing protein n=1 Tax=Plenodomus tracheiphilus IPT5 TaxID=1408161 RepID=A0A6A7AX84_9PLEO|nr:hypothetical protein T440DRAFT_540872 [Plenodomus tracheiphilus IPT5]
MGRQVRKRRFSKAFSYPLGHINDAYRRAFKKTTPTSVAASLGTPDQALTVPLESLISNKYYQLPSPPRMGRLVPEYPQPDLSTFNFSFPLDFDVDLLMSADPSAHGSLPDSMPGGAISQGINWPIDSSAMLLSPNMRRWLDSSATEDQAVNHHMFDSSPRDSTVELSSSPPRGPVLGSCLGQDFTIHEDSPSFTETYFTVGNQSSPTGILTPSALNFQDLSLFDVPGWPQSETLSPRLLVGNRTSYYTLPSILFTRCFPNLATDILLSFAKGKQHLSIPKQTLCVASPYFANLLNVPYPPTHTQLLRLRDDFPPAIPATHAFLTTGTYFFDPAILTTYPSTTLPDLHIHTYLTALKYNIPTLVHHAQTQYLTFAHAILHLGIVAPTNITPDPQTTKGNIMIPPLLNSFVLLWRNTASCAGDALRRAVVQDLLVPHVNRWCKVDGFVVLMRGLHGFGRDVVEGVAEEGFEVQVVGVKAGWGIRFGKGESWRGGGG